MCKSQDFAGEIGTSIWDGEGLNIPAGGREWPAELYYFLPQSPGIYTYPVAEDVAALLAAAGFTHIRMEVQQTSGDPSGCCVLGQK